MSEDSTQLGAPESPLPAEIQQLPPEMRTMVSVMAGFFRSTSGPDPETAKVMAETEMHEESCKLEGFKQSLSIRDQQNARDQIFRIKRLNHETFKSTVVMMVCIGFMVCGLYLIVQKRDTAVGASILVAGFTLLGGKLPASDKKD